MDYCSARKYSEYAGSAVHSMTSRIGVNSVLSGGPPNRMAPNVTVVPGHRHPQVLRYHQEHEQRLAALHTSEGFYHQHQQQQHHAFERYIPSVNYSADYHHQPSSFVAAGLGYESLGRRHVTSAYLNAHTPLPHHLYHPPHYDRTYNGRMIGGGGGQTPLAYHSYREGYDHLQGGIPQSSIHHYSAARNSAFQYGNSASAATQQQREYLNYYPFHPTATFMPEHRYSQHNSHSINGLQVQSHKNEGRMTKKSAQHIIESEASYAQQQNLPSLSSMGMTMIASPLTGGSTTTDSGISGSSRCGSTPISMATSSAGLSGGEYSMNASMGIGLDERCVSSKEYNKDDQENPSERNDEIENGVSSTNDQQLSPSSSVIISSSSPCCESEGTFNEKQCASNRRLDCQTPVLSERCGTPFNSNNHHSPSFHSPHRYQYAQQKSPSTLCDKNEAPSISPKPLSPKAFSPSPSIKRIYSPECAPSSTSFEEKKNRVVECDLIPSKKSKRKALEAEDVREEIRNIKPLPGFQQAFGSTEIGRFFETFRNIPTSSYAYEYDIDTLNPQSFEIENSVDGSQFDVQISASLQTMYKCPLADKKYLNGIRCNGY